MPSTRRFPPPWIIERLRRDDSLIAPEAAVGAASPADAAISLRLALMLENVGCRPT